MASGWANDDAVNEQINSTIEDAIARARGEIPRGESLDECEECGGMRHRQKPRRFYSCSVPGMPLPVPPRTRQMTELKEP